MANRIKGITVEIGGDTTGLDKALKGVNTTIRTTQTSLRDVNRLLKLDPGNAQLLAQKQKLLQESIKGTTEKLSALKEADKQAKQQMIDGNLGQDKYDALQREIIETEQSLQKLEEQAKKVPSSLSVGFSEAGEKLKSVGEKTTELGTNLTTHITAPITAIGAVSLSAFNEVDRGLDTIITKTGASGESLEEMKGILERITTSIPTDFETAGKAIGEINTRFGLTGDALEGLSTKFIKFAELNNIDVSSAVDRTQKVMTAFGLTTDDVGALLDTMNAVGQRTGISMDTLATSMVTNSAALQQLGFSASDAANFLGNVEMSGADTSQVMSGLTKALANATAKGKPMNEALSEIQQSMTNAKSETEGLKVAYELFGKKAGAAIYQACKSGSLSFEQLGTSLQENLGNVEQTFDATLDPIDSFKTTMNSLKLVGAEVGNSLMTVLEPVLKQVASGLKDIKEKWTSLSPGMQSAIVKFVLLAATVGPVVVIIGKFISAIGVIISAIGSLISVFTGASVGIGALSTALLPIIGTIAAVVAAVVAIVLAIQNWGSIVEWFKGVWETIVQTISSVMQTISMLFSTVWTSIITTLQGTWETIKNVVQVGVLAIGAILEAALGIITLPFQFIWENCKEVLMSAWYAMSETVSNVLNAIGAVINSVLSSILGIFTSIWQGISGVVMSVLNNIQTVITTVFSTISNVTSTVWNGVSSVISSIINTIQSVVSSVFTTLSNTVSAVFDGIKNTAVSVWNGVKAAIIGPVQAARDTVKSAVDAIVGFFSGIRLELPHISLPHFSIQGSFSLAPPSVPHLSIDWYKEGGIMTRPTIFGMNGSSLLAGGEAGHEAILPLKGFYTQLDQMLSQKLNFGGMEQYLAIIADNSSKGIYLEDGTLVGKLLPSIDQGLGRMAIRRERG